MDIPKRLFAGLDHLKNTQSRCVVLVSSQGSRQGHRRQSGPHYGGNLESAFNISVSAKVQAVGQFHSPAKIKPFLPLDRDFFGYAALQMAEVAVRVVAPVIHHLGICQQANRILRDDVSFSDARRKHLLIAGEYPQ